MPTLPDPVSIELLIQKILNNEFVVDPTTPTEIIETGALLQNNGQEGGIAMEHLEQVGFDAQELGVALEEMQSSAGTKPFNMKKAQYQEIDQRLPQLEIGTDPVETGMDIGVPETEVEQMYGDGSPLQLTNNAEFRSWLDSQAMGREQDAAENIEQTYQILLPYKRSDRTDEDLKNGLEQYYTAVAQVTENQNMTEGEKDRVSLYIFQQILSDAIRGTQIDTGEGEILQAPYTEGSMKVDMTSINKVAETIKEIAKKTVAKESKKKEASFNLRKMAQHKTQENVIMWGPAQTRIDPFTRQPVSDWHIMERNKGWGLVVGDRWNIDWEAIWRGNIMDKYSRPYRNKDGEWVGGYIQKRFEVDKNIPETNNLQLKPGQKRKPYMPEYGNIEARLEAMRAKGDRGYGPASEGKPFNWKTAQAQEQVQTIDQGNQLLAEYKTLMSQWNTMLPEMKQSNQGKNLWNKISSIMNDYTVTTGIALQASRDSQSGKAQLVVQASKKKILTVRKH